MVGPGALPVSELAALGVARISLGSAIAQSAYALVGRAAHELLIDGQYRAIDGALDYGDLNRLMTTDPETRT